MSRSLKALFLIFAISILFNATAGPDQQLDEIQNKASLTNPYGLKAETTNTKKIFELFPLNIRVFRWFNSLHNPVIDKIALFMDTLYIPFEKMHMRADIGLAWVLIPVLIYIFMKRRNIFLPLIVALLLETLILVVAKHFWHQPRPGAILVAVHEVQHLRNNSFPSGHAAMMAVISIFMIIRTKTAGTIFWILAFVIICWQRLYTGSHFPLDLAVGILIGIVPSIIAILIFKKTIIQESSIMGNPPVSK